MNLNKTARYVLPAEIYLVILLAYFLTRVRMATSFGVLIYLYVFLAGISTFLPTLPLTNFMESQQKPLVTDNESYPYYFVYRTMIADESLYLKKVYNLAEETRFNDAGLIWYFTQQHAGIRTVGEFSPYETVERALTEAETADMIIVEMYPDSATDICALAVYNERPDLLEYHKKFVDSENYRSS
jgi:hypothetical protein